MAIQPIVLGAPVTGAGGDKYREAHTKINANFAEVGADIVAIKAKDVTQDAAIAAKAVKSETTTALNLKANITDVDAKNNLQDAAINLKAVKTEVTAALGLKADTADVNAKNTTQDNAINLRATTASVDAKNSTQDTAIAAANSLATAAIPNTQKGAVNGVASLGANGKVVSAQLPAVTPVTWGNITGSIASQTDLTAIMFTKAEGAALTTAISQARLYGDYYAVTTPAPANAFIDTDGKMKRSTATAPVFGTAATKDAGSSAGNVFEVGVGGSIAVGSIKAGLGAPQIAYKKLTGTSGSANSNFSVAHGLDAAKILSISVTIFASTGNYMGVSSIYTYLHNATDVVVSLGATASPVANRPFTMLITYEV